MKEVVNKMSSVKSEFSFIKYDRNYNDGVRSLFLNDKSGILDTVNKVHEDIWEKYELLKSLDWAPSDVDLSTSKDEFIAAPAKMKKLMIDNITWQWEADSSVSTLIALVQPFISSSELLVYFSEVSRNEVLHAITYSEIVRNSFDNPSIVIDEMLKNKKAMERALTVNEALDQVNIVGSKLNLGLIDRDDPSVRDTIMLFMVALFALERIQFMASFTITCGIAESGWFLAPAKLIQKILTDEYQVHVQGDKLILKNELSTKEGIESFKRIEDKVYKIISEIVDSEIDWLYHTYTEDFIKGVTLSMLCDAVYHSATDVYNTLELKNPYKEVYDFPVDYMSEWIDLNKYQRSPQDEDLTNYLVGGIIKDDKKITLDDV